MRGKENSKEYPRSEKSTQGRSKLGMSPCPQAGTQTCGRRSGCSPLDDGQAAGGPSARWSIATRQAGNAHLEGGGLNLARKPWSGLARGNILWGTRGQGWQTLWSTEGQGLAHGPVQGLWAQEPIFQLVVMRPDVRRAAARWSPSCVGTESLPLCAQLVC